MTGLNEFRTDSRRFCMTKGHALLVLAILLSLTTTSVHGFDGKRKGFVAGVGLGASPYSHWSSSEIARDISEAGLGVDMLIGYAWNDNNMLVYSGMGTVYMASNLNNTSVVQGVNGVRWYHYWGAKRRPFFTAVGLGELYLGTEYVDVTGAGFGYELGVGKELFKQVQAGLYVMGGNSSNDSGVKANHFDLMFLVTIVAY